MRLLTILGVAVGGGLLLALLWLLYQAQQSQHGEPAGLVRGRLSDCPSSPNCVSSEEGTPSAKRVPPLRFEGSPEQAWQRLQRAIEAQGGVLGEVSDRYLAATYRSALFGFVDDLEARLDPERSEIQLRSASRVGRSDLGANRVRVAELSARFTPPPAS